MSSTTPQIWIMFDSSIVFEDSVRDMVRESVRKLIESQGQSPLSLSWFLPGVVLHERQYQMQQSALQSLAHAKKLESLGLNITIGKSDIDAFVNDAVVEQTKSLHLEIADLDPSKVNWKRLIVDACYRHPPFSAGSSEKGFRDAVAVETFVQLVDRSVKDATRCLVILATNDDGQVKAIEERLGSFNYVRVAKSPGEIEETINTVAQHLKGSFVAAYRGKAERYFLERVRDQAIAEIRNKHAKELEAIGRESDWLFETRFSKMHNQRFDWVTRVSALGEYALRDRGAFPSGSPYYVQPSAPAAVYFPYLYPYLGGAPDPQKGAGYYLVDPSASGQPALYSAAGGPSLSVIVRSRAHFEVVWSSQTDQRENLVDHQIVDVKYISTTLE